MILKKLLLLGLVLFLTVLSWGQANEKVHKNEPSRSIHKPNKLVKLNSLYFEEVNVLKTYFVSGEIKSGFPGYNHSLTKEVNAMELEKWLAIEENKKHLTPEGLIAIQNYIKEK